VPYEAILYPSDRELCSQSTTSRLENLPDAGTPWVAMVDLLQVFAAVDSIVFRTRSMRSEKTSVYSFKTSSLMSDFAVYADREARNQ
jgi:hypothetical protein